MNYEARDQRAEIAGSILRGVAGIAGAALGGQAAFGIAEAWSPSQLAAITNLGSGDLPNPVKLAKTPAEMCYLLANPDEAGQLLLDRHASEQDVREILDRRVADLEAVGAGTDLGLIRSISARDSLHARRQEILTQRLASTRAAIDAGVRKHGADNGLIARDTIIRVVAHFDLSDLPADLPRNLAVSQFDESLSESAKLQTFFRETRLAIAVRPHQTATPIAGAAANSPQLACGSAERRNCAKIYYREPITREVQV